MALPACLAKLAFFQRPVWKQRDPGEVAKRSNAADCKSVALAASEVRILPSPFPFARCASRRRARARQASLGASSLARSRVRSLRANLTDERRERVGTFGSLRRADGSGAKPPEARSQGGSNSVVESQPSKLLVAGSIPVSRSNLRSRLTTVRELRLAGRRRLSRRSCGAAKADAKR